MAKLYLIKPCYARAVLPGNIFIATEEIAAELASGATPLVRTGLKMAGCILLKKVK